MFRIAAINCYADENNDICDQHNVRAYPTLRVRSPVALDRLSSVLVSIEQLIAPETTINTSKVIAIPATDAKNVERELIKELSALTGRDGVWPNFTPMK